MKKFKIFLSLKKEEEIKIFEDKKVRTLWDEESEKWYISIVDVVEILTESKDFQTARKYWNKLKQRFKILIFFIQ